MSVKNTGVYNVHLPRMSVRVYGSISREKRKGIGCLVGWMGMCLGI